MTKLVALALLLTLAVLMWAVHRLLADRTRLEAEIAELRKRHLEQFERDRLALSRALMDKKPPPSLLSPPLKGPTFEGGRADAVHR